MGKLADLANEVLALEAPMELWVEVLAVPH